MRAGSLGGSYRVGGAPNTAQQGGETKPGPVPGQRFSRKKILAVTGHPKHLQLFLQRYLTDFCECDGNVTSPTAHRSPSTGTFRSRSRSSALDVCESPLNPVDLGGSACLEEVKA